MGTDLFDLMDILEWQAQFLRGITILELSNRFCIHFQITHYTPTSLSLSLYPLVTHDPNMLKKKSRGNLVGKIKIVSFRREIENFC